MIVLLGLLLRLLLLLLLILRKLLLRLLLLLLRFLLLQKLLLLLLRILLHLLLRLLLLLLRLLLLLLLRFLLLLLLHVGRRCVHGHNILASSVHRSRAALGLGLRLHLSGGGSAGCLRGRRLRSGYVCLNDHDVSRRGRAGAWGTGRHARHNNIG